MSMLAGRESLGQAVAARRGLILRIALIAALALAEVLIGTFAPRGRQFQIPLIMLAVSAAVFGLALVYRVGRFEFGILTVPLSAGLLNFITFPTGTQSRIVMSLIVSLALMAVWALQSVARTRQQQWPATPIKKPILAFVAVSIISFGWTTVLRDPLVIVPPKFAFVQTAALVVNITLPLLALLVASKIHEINWLQWLNWMVIGLGVLAAISFLFNLPTAALISNGARGVFPAWVGALVCAQALFNEKLPRWGRLLLLAFLAALIYYYFIRIPDWFSGWLPLGVAVGVIMFRRSKKLFLLTLALGLGFLAFHPEVITQNVLARAQNKGDFERLDLWRMNLELVAQHPLLGVGPAGYAVYNVTYHPADARSTHNNYFDVLAQTGVIGLAVFLFLFGVFGWVGVSNCLALSHQRGFEEAFAVATLAGCAAALAAMMLGDWVLPFAYNQTISAFDNAAFTWLFLGCAVSLRQILAARRPVITASMAA